MIYLDNAATSYPKNEAALRRAMERYLALGASPGRGGYDRAVEAEHIVSNVRRNLTEFFGAPPGSRVCFTANATDALNTLIQGLARNEPHVVSTHLEHNSVLRPLQHMQRAGRLHFDLAEFDRHGFVSTDAVESLLHGQTRAVIMTHASNVLGTIQPLDAIGAMLHARGIPLCVDASQTAGLVPIDMEATRISALAITGHKSLGGPTGIGALILAPDFDLLPTRFGGTGVDSRNPYQPDAYPARLEAGTLNMLGILAFEECLNDLTAAEQTSRLQRERGLLQRLRKGLLPLPGVSVFGGHDPDRQVPLLSCAVHGMPAADVGAILDGDFDIAVRTGLHCAPLAHDNLDTRPHGTVRFSLGTVTTTDDIDAAVTAMTSIAAIR